MLRGSITSRSCKQTPPIRTYIAEWFLLILCCYAESSATSATRTFTTRLAVCPNYAVLDQPQYGLAAGVLPTLRQPFGSGSARAISKRLHFTHPMASYSL